MNSNPFQSWSLSRIYPPPAQGVSPDWLEPISYFIPLGTVIGSGISTQCRPEPVNTWHVIATGSGRDSTWPNSLSLEGSPGFWIHGWGRHSLFLSDYDEEACRPAQRGYPPCKKEGDCLGWGPWLHHWATGLKQPWSLPSGFSMTWSNQLPCYLGQCVLGFLLFTVEYILTSALTMCQVLREGLSHILSQWIFTMAQWRRFHPSLFTDVRCPVKLLMSGRARVQSQVCPSLRPLLSAMFSWLLLWYLWAQQWGETLQHHPLQ